MEPVESYEIENSSYVPLATLFKDIEEVLNKSNTSGGEHIPETNTLQLSYAIKRETRCGTALDINDYFERMLRLYSQDEMIFKSIMQVFYQVMKDFSDIQGPFASNLVLNGGWVELLVDILFSKTWKKTTISDALLCIKLYFKIFCEDNIVHRLWQTLLIYNAKSNSVTTTITYVLIQFFDEFSKVIDDFECSRDVESIVYKLLQSDVREDRKAALYLMKKCTSSLDTEVRIFWISGIAVLQNLEENQSHLILPSLECFKQNHLNTVRLKIWQDILLIKILSHQNILVIRWALEYISETFTCVDISSEVLLQFLKASNHTSLYNHDNYCLPMENVQKFLKGRIDRLMETISEVNLKSVPLHFWLHNISRCKSNIPLNSNELILKVAARIRLLQNQALRLKSIELFKDIFYEAIRTMSLSEYIILIETLYNVTDPFAHFETFCCKLKKCCENGDEFWLTQRFYEIITNNLYGEHISIQQPLQCIPTQHNINHNLNNTQSKQLEDIADIFENMKKSGEESNVWIALMLILESEINDVVRNTCQSFWDLNLERLIGVPFELLYLEITSLLSFGRATTTFVRQKCTDFFAKTYLANFSDLKKYAVKAEDLLNTGSHKTLLKLSQLLANSKEKEDVTIVDDFLIALKRYSRMLSLCYIVATNLLKYISINYPSCQLENYAKQILCIDLENVSICAAVLDSGIILDEETYVKGIMIDKAYFGDARIEELYLLKLDESQCARLQQIRLRYILSIPDDYTDAILNELFKTHKTLSEKKPRYFENSTEHRLKMRIANAMLLKIHPNMGFSNEALLDLVLNHNNQLNINYMYELIVAKCATGEGLILNKLNEVTKYTPSQQVSLICIANCYTFLNWETLSKEYLYTVVNKLLPLTMGAHFQTRLYAQLVIYNILRKSSSNCNFEPLLWNHINMQEAIALAVGPQLNELLNDVRLLLPFIYLSGPTDFFDIIMYITMAPADEYLSNLDYSRYEASKYIFSKKKNSFMQKMPASEQTVTSKANLQRKMNPEIDLCARSSLMESETTTKFEMIIVASLIDKIPNLGGIARTCEILGIRNLVLSSKLLAEKEDFKSVSMTAEKYLNIIEVRPSNLQEFFKEKQADDFKIIGAEQTVDSVNIMNFEFPRKCVLVLGHEKEGIPSNILGFLDNTIEIPQFGVLRSLNVHVTGALFMWEYCKQYINRSL